MVVNLQTDSWLVVAPITIGILSLLAAWWKFLSFWERMWSESLSSRSVDRRMVRWQRTLFRGRALLGRWGGPGKLAGLRVLILVSRGIVLLIAAVLLVSIAVRLLKT
ncbi:MAG TPA: hypothetical protein VFV19_04725 [Candidatus Polarisedimenticolaceae bacterium]|nr:hypothetical protein [Candidatus Polarisedimenticolaceae bacterium]